MADAPQIGRQMRGCVPQQGLKAGFCPGWGRLTTKINGFARAAPAGVRLLLWVCCGAPALPALLFLPPFIATSAAMRAIFTATVHLADRAAPLALRVLACRTGAGA